MSEWWTYRPSDFLLFSARTYCRLFERYNAEMWPAQVLAIVLGLAVWLALWQGRTWAPRAACALFGAAWLWVALRHQNHGRGAELARSQLGAAECAPGDHLGFSTSIDRCVHRVGHAARSALWPGTRDWAR